MRPIEHAGTCISNKLEPQFTKTLTLYWIENIRMLNPVSGFVLLTGIFYRHKAHWRKPNPIDDKWLILASLSPLRIFLERTLSDM